MSYHHREGGVVAEERTLMDVARAEAGRYLSGHSIMYRFRDDIVSDACYGAAQAAANYDPSKGATLNTYASRRARGAVIDGIRDRSPVPRWQYAHGVTLNDLPPQERPPVSVEQWADEGWDAAATGDLEGGVAERDLVERMLATCTERERLILTANLLHGYSLTDIADHLGVTLSAISQQRGAALKRLRTQFIGSWKAAA
jgi:RNA polymerase sigma factor (sigma-70 family)